MSFFFCSIEVKDVLKKFYIALSIKFHENSYTGSNAIPY